MNARIMLLISLSFVLVLPGARALSAGEKRIPYPAALDSAAVVEDSLNDVQKKSLVLGNGDLNALLFSQGESLKLRISKNDVWDARVDTSEDPPPARFDVKNHSWKGGASRVTSWHGRSYPLPRTCAIVTITPATEVQASKPWKGKLDLRRAVARATKGKSAIATAVRVLAGRNVILVDSTAAVSIAQVPASYFAAAKTGTTDGAAWIHQVLPGDPDYKGMEFAVASTAKGNLKAIAVVTSWEAKDVLAAAIKLAKQTLSVDKAATIRGHEGRWNKFWSASGVELADRAFQNWWYRCLYHMGCFCKPGTVPIGLHAGLPTDRVGWHSSYKLNYNTQQTFWPQFVCNHVEGVEPLVKLLKSHLPRARWFARFTYDCQGAFFHSDLFPFEPQDAAACKTRNKRQCCYVPWGYTLGMTSWAAWHTWLCYEYQPDPKVLKEDIYPILKDVSLFFLDFMSKCRKGPDGKVILGPSYSPEHGPFGTDNNPFDIAFTLNLFEAFIKASSILGRDAELAARCRKAIAEMPEYPTARHKNGTTVVVDWKGCRADQVKVHNITVPVVPVFPGERLSWFSPDEQKKLFKQTIRVTRHNGYNAHVMLNVARARLSMPEAIGETRKWYSSREAPNGLFIEQWGTYGSESWAVAGLVSEFMLQSAGEIIRIFPCWPEKLDAKFSTLRCRGGFLVTAEQRGGKTTRLEIASTVGGRLRLLSPWPTIKVKTNSGTKALKADARGVVEIETKAGDKLAFTAN